MPVHLLQFAKKMAYDAGKIALKIQEKGFKIDHKSGPLDLVTDADKACNEFIIKTIENHFPDHSILTEESGSKEKSGEYKWIIDPIDGTTNFARGLPWFAISIAVVHKGQPIIGVVEVPALRQTFYAIKGKGAHLNNKPIHVSKKGKIEECLFATGFPYERAAKFDRSMKLFNEFYKSSLGVRRFGSASIDLCYIAKGSFDGFWEFGLEPWDVAAGKIIVEEAGGVVTNMDGSTFNPKLKNILASNGILHQQMIESIRTNT